MPDLDANIYFSGGDNINPDDLGTTEVDNFTTAVDVALRDRFQWDGKAVGAVALTTTQKSNADFLLPVAKRTCPSLGPPATKFGKTILAMSHWPSVSVH